MAVRAWRGRQKQEDVAAAAGITPDTLSDLENGNRWPRNGTLRAIEEALGRAPGELDQIAASADQRKEADRWQAIDARYGRENGQLLREIVREVAPDRAAAILTGLEAKLSARESRGAG
jgi:transcriptional regulator with XRE-family HTH domain